MAHAPNRAARAAAAAAAFACAVAAASPSDVVTGTLVTADQKTSGTASCLGTPTCSGIANVTSVHNDPNCSNRTFSFSASITYTGFDLSHSGHFSGTFTISQLDSGHTVNSDGTCTYHLVPGATWPYDGNWDATTGSGTVAIHSLDTSGVPNEVDSSFSAKLAAAAPVFPMTVTGSVTTTTTDAEATLSVKPQDTGTPQNVYVFTHAPASLVGHAAAKAVGGPSIPATHDDAVVCVLAQVTSDGHLVATSASTMSSALSNVLGSQSQAVQLLNNVPTPNVAGATVFVGYGTSAAAMLSSGVYEAALSVPGAIQCSASLAAAPAPTSPGSLSGLWWNESESGWGIHFTQRGTNLFAAWYTYDTAGNPKWYVAPNCGFTAANATSGSCTSALYEVDGPTFFGTTFHPPTGDQVKNDGTLQLAFQDPNNATFTYTVGSFTRTVPIVRQVFNVPHTATPAVDYTDLWWDSDESGWGMAITHQSGNIFLAWYVYDANGKPFWYVAPACTVEGSSCSGTLYRTTGPAFGPPLDPTKVQATSVGSALVSFIDANNGVLSYTVNGVSGSKPIKRQLF